MFSFEFYSQKSSVAWMTFEKLDGILQKWSWQKNLSDKLYRSPRILIYSQFAAFWSSWMGELVIHCYFYYVQQRTLWLSRTGQWSSINTVLTEMHALEKWNMNGNLVPTVQIPFFWGGGMYSDINKGSLWVTMEESAFITPTRLD